MRRWKMDYSLINTLQHPIFIYSDVGKGIDIKSNVNLNKIEYTGPIICVAQI